MYIIKSALHSWRSEHSKFRCNWNIPVVSVLLHDSLEIPVHTCAHVRSITVSSGRTGVPTTGAVASRSAALFEAAPFSYAPQHHCRDVPPDSDGAAYLAERSTVAAPHLRPRPLLCHSNPPPPESRSSPRALPGAAAARLVVEGEEVFLGGSVRAWYMVVRTAAAQLLLTSVQCFSRGSEDRLDRRRRRRDGKEERKPVRTTTNTLVRGP